MLRIRHFYRYCSKQLFYSTWKQQSSSSRKYEDITIAFLAICVIVTRSYIWREVHNRVWRSLWHRVHTYDVGTASLWRFWRINQPQSKIWAEKKSKQRGKKTVSCNCNSCSLPLESFVWMGSHQEQQWRLYPVSEWCSIQLSCISPLFLRANSERQNAV